MAPTPKGTGPALGVVAVVGVGLIGGSLGLALRARGACREVIGVDPGPLDLALERGAVERALPLEAAAKAADLIVLAAPVGALPGLARALKPHLRPETVVTDTGSVKGYVLDHVAPLLGGRFVGAHPIAGRERSGVGAAEADLFEGAACVLTPVEASDDDAVAAVSALWRAVGARVTTMPAAVHDRVFACVSHLPHLVAFALMGAVERTRPDGVDPVAYSAGGLRDFTRVAGADPVMWRDICLTNPEALLAMIETFQRELAGIGDAVRAGDGEGLLARFEAARRVRARVAP